MVLSGKVDINLHWRSLGDGALGSQRMRFLTMALLLAEGMPDRLEWLKNQADAMTECGDTAGAMQLLKDASERFEKDGKYLLAVGRQYALLCEIEEAKKFVKRAIKADSSLKAEFLDDPAFDPVWESF